MRKECVCDVDSRVSRVTLSRQAELRKDRAREAELLRRSVTESERGAGVVRCCVCEYTARDRDSLKEHLRYACVLGNVCVFWEMCVCVYKRR